MDRRGQVYFMDTGGGVWKIDSQGHLTKHDRSMFHWMAIDLDGRFKDGRMPTWSFGDFSRAVCSKTL